MPDTCICPHCGITLDIDDNYGFNMRCSKCKGKIDVFPDESLIIRLPIGLVVVSELTK
jgi:hypothetical protein